MDEFTLRTLYMLKERNKMLKDHPNSNLYRYVISLFVATRPFSLCFHEFPLITVFVFKFVNYKRLIIFSTVLINIHLIILCNHYFLFFINRKLSNFIQLDGFYLESDPCLVCNNPELSYNVRTKH